MEEDILNYLSTAMFRGTPCVYVLIYPRLFHCIELKRYSLVLV